MIRPLLLDLFCCAGGAATGYHRAGFDIIGVDISPQPRYPFPFVQADALRSLETWDLSRFAAIHLSPPCQDHMRARTFAARGTGWMLGAARRVLADRASVPWVIENVPGAPLRADYRLCGCMFGLPHLKRERWFETSWHAFELRTACSHRDGTMSVTGTNPGSRTEKRTFGHWPTRQDWQRAMGIDWMTNRELTQAIPPAYTEHIGHQLIEHIGALEAAS